jgi:hypothetical protein
LFRLYGANDAEAYSCDLRGRAIEAVETGASRREAAERFEVSVSSAVKWVQHWRQTRSAAPKPRGGSRDEIMRDPAMVKPIGLNPDTVQRLWQTFTDGAPGTKRIIMYSTHEQGGK